MVFSEKCHRSIPKRHDYHTAFDINRKRILNIAPDKTKNNSAATVKMVKDLMAMVGPHTKNLAYRKIFKKFYDFSDAS